MRVLLLGATGNLGRRCVPALLSYNHDLILYVRYPDKLKTIFTPEVLSRVKIVVGDATDSISMRQVLIDHDIEGIVNVAGNQVRPGKELVLPKIAKAVSDAALAAGEEKGTALRLWLVSGLNVLEYPGTGYSLDDYMPRIGVQAHTASKDVIEPIPIEKLKWSLICVAIMKPIDPKQTVFDVMESPRGHNLLLGHTSPPAWTNTWAFHVPWIGAFLNLWYLIFWKYDTIYEDVADLMAGDLTDQNSQWIGKKVGMKDKAKDKVKTV